MMWKANLNSKIDGLVTDKFMKCILFVMMQFMIVFTCIHKT